jgi:plasmid stability protein
MKMDDRSALITVCGIPREVLDRLRARAGMHGRTVEAEVRCILEVALAPKAALPGQHLYERVRARFSVLGGVDLDLPSREGTGERRCTG